MAPLYIWQRDIDRLFKQSNQGDLGEAVRLQEQVEFERRINEYEVEFEMPEVITLRERVIPPKYLKMKILGWKTVPEVLYPIPMLIVEGLPEREQAFVAGLIEGEGSFAIDTSRLNQVDKGIYRYTYVRPRFSFTMYEKPPVERVGGALGLEPLPYPAPPKPVKGWYVASTGSPAVAIAHWSLGWLTKGSLKYMDARRYLTLFRTTKSIRL